MTIESWKDVWRAIGNALAAIAAAVAFGLFCLAVVQFALGTFWIFDLGTVRPDAIGKAAVSADARVQAIATVVGNALGIMGAFAVAWWSLSKAQRTEKEQDAKLASVVAELLAQRTISLCVWSEHEAKKPTRDFARGRSIQPLPFGIIVEMPGGSQGRIGMRFPGAELRIAACDAHSKKAATFIGELELVADNTIDLGFSVRGKNLTRARRAIGQIRQCVIDLRKAYEEIEGSLRDSDQKERVGRHKTRLNEAADTLNACLDRIEAAKKGKTG